MSEEKIHVSPEAAGFCEFCGAELELGGSFCPMCGEKTDEETEKGTEAQKLIKTEKAKSSTIHSKDAKETIEKAAPLAFGGFGKGPSKQHIKHEPTTPAELIKKAGEEVKADKPETLAKSVGELEKKPDERERKEIKPTAFGKFMEGMIQTLEKNPSDLEKRKYVIYDASENTDEKKYPYGKFDFSDLLDSYGFREGGIILFRYRDEDYRKPSIELKPRPKPRLEICLISKKGDEDKIRELIEKEHYIDKKTFNLNGTVKDRKQCESYFQKLFPFLDIVSLEYSYR